MQEICNQLQAANLHLFSKKTTTTTNNNNNNNNNNIK